MHDRVPQRNAYVNNAGEVDFAAFAADLDAFWAKSTVPEKTFYARAVKRQLELDRDQAQRLRDRFQRTFRMMGRPWLKENDHLRASLYNDPELSALARKLLPQRIGPNPTQNDDLAKRQYKTNDQQEE